MQNLTFEELREEGEKGGYPDLKNSKNPHT